MHALEESDFAPDFILEQGTFEARCTLTRKGESKVALQGTLRATVTLVCDRCLTSYQMPLQTVMHLLFEVASQEHWQVKELDCQAADLDTIQLIEPVVDLNDAVRQQLILALPIKNLCSETCRGICPQCGVNYNLNACECGAEVASSPFAVLAQLKK